MYANENRLIEAILMSTHNIPFSILNENNPKLSQICSYRIFFQGTQEQVRNSHGKQAMSVRATEGLLYVRVIQGVSLLALSTITSCAYAYKLNHLAF